MERNNGFIAEIIRNLRTANLNKIADKIRNGETVTINIKLRKALKKWGDTLVAEFRENRIFLMTAGYEDGTKYYETIFFREGFEEDFDAHRVAMYFSRSVANDDAKVTIM